VPSPMQRVQVDFFVRGQAQIHWVMDPHFLDPLPWTFQLQVSETDIVSDASVWRNVGTPAQNVNILTDPNSEIPAGKDQNIFYRVALTNGAYPNPLTYFSDPAQIFGDLPFHVWFLGQEIVRKEKLRLSRLQVGTEGILLKRKRSGVPCTQCTDPYGSGEQTDSACPTCFGTRFVGGFYVAQAQVYTSSTLDQVYPHHEPQAEGTADQRTITGRFVGTPWLTSFDVWVSRTSDMRYMMHGKKVLADLRGVPFIYDVEMKLIPFNDIIYAFPRPA
jgi:hypothetical protein